MDRYYLGFNQGILVKDRLVQEIDVESNAYKAGLRNGQKIVNFDIPNDIGKPDQTITIRTAEGTFQFKPEHYNKLDIYQLKTIISPNEEKVFNKFFDII